MLTGSAPKYVYAEPAIEQAGLRMMQEATAIAQALGADPTTNHAARIANQRSMDHKPSILQDLELGRPMEIDGMFDAPLALAQHGRRRGADAGTAGRAVQDPRPVGRAVSMIRGRNKVMEMREFGRTGMRLSILGFGCGAVGGLMVRGSPADQDRAIGEALDAGINYFDTAVQYGNGVSETNLGRVLDGAKRDRRRMSAPRSASPSERVRPHRRGRDRVAGRQPAPPAMDHVDIFHLHNPITLAAAVKASAWRR